MKIKIGENTFSISAINNDKFLEDEGIFVFDSAFGSGYTFKPEKIFLQIAVINNMVVYIGENSSLVPVPGADGYLICFCGSEAVGQASDIKIGQTAEADFNIEIGSLYTVFFGNKKVGINSVDIDHFTKGEDRDTILFTPEHRYPTTRTKSGRIEYTVIGGKITEISYSGSSYIPRDGYVISTEESFPEFTVLKNIKIGDNVILSKSENLYSFASLPFNGYNCPRTEGSLIIYNSGLSTGTCEYGYEIQVDKNGIIVGSDSYGSIEIPEGGFVLSCFGGPTGQLRKNTRNGASVIIDDENNTVYIVYTPVNAYNQALKNFSLLKESIRQAYLKMLDVDYKAIGKLKDKIDLELKRERKAVRNDISALRNSIITDTENLYNLLIPSPAVEDRGVWHIPCEMNDEEVRFTVEGAVKLGLNFLIIDTWANGYTYYHSKLEGVLVNEKYRDFDPLEAFVRIGHEYGLKIHSSFCTFMDGPVNRVLPPEHPTQRKGWLTLSRNGYNYGINVYGTSYSLDPNNPEVRAYMTSIMCEVAERYHVDGIHYDYVRFPQPSQTTGDFGYNEDIVKGFQAKYSTSVNPADITEDHELWEAWYEYRCDVVSSFVKECTAAIKHVDKNIIVSAAVFAGIEQMKSSIFQDARFWAEKRYLDCLFPMIYTPSVKSFFKYGSRAISAATDKTYLVMGFGTFEYYPIETIMTEVDYSRKNNAGLCFFTLDSLLKPFYRKYMEEGIFKRKATPAESDEAFPAAVKDLIRRIDEIYMPMYGHEQEFGKIKKMLSVMDAKSIQKILVYAENHIEGAALERISESLEFIRQLTVEKGFKNA